MSNNTHKNPLFTSRLDSVIPNEIDVTNKLESKRIYLRALREIVDGRDTPENYYNRRVAHLVETIANAQDELDQLTADKDNAEERIAQCESEIADLEKKLLIAKRGKQLRKLAEMRKKLGVTDDN